MVCRWVPRSLGSPTCSPYQGINEHTTSTANRNALAIPSLMDFEKQRVTDLTQSNNNPRANSGSASESRALLTPSTSSIPPAKEDATRFRAQNNFMDRQSFQPNSLA